MEMNRKMNPDATLALMQQEKKAVKGEGLLF